MISHGPGFGFSRFVRDFGSSRLASLVNIHVVFVTEAGTAFGLYPSLHRSGDRQTGSDGGRRRRRRARGCHVRWGGRGLRWPRSGSARVPGEGGARYVERHGETTKGLKDLVPSQPERQVWGSQCPTGSCVRRTGCGYNHCHQAEPASKQTA